MTVEQTPVIRRADDEDGPALASLRREWSREQAGHDLDDDGFAERFSAWLAAGAGHRVSFLAEVDRTPVGMVGVVVFERMPTPDRAPSRWCYLANAFVLAAHRDAGIGTALLDAAVAHARHLRAARVVVSPSERSEAFYRRAGFGPATMLRALTLD